MPSWAFVCSRECGSFSCCAASAPMRRDAPSALWTVQRRLPKPLQAMAWEMIAGMRGDLLLPSQAFEAAGRVLQLYEELGDRAGVARSLRHRGIAQLRLGRYAEAEEDLRRALELSKVYGDRRDVARALGSIGVVA